jgi:hypothetical protein
VNRVVDTNIVEEKITAVMNRMEVIENAITQDQEHSLQVLQSILNHVKKDGTVKRR